LILRHITNVVELIDNIFSYWEHLIPAEVLHT